MNNSTAALNKWGRPVPLEDPQLAPIRVLFCKAAAFDRKKWDVGSLALALFIRSGAALKRRLEIRRRLGC